MSISEFAGKVRVVTEAEAHENRKIPTLNPQQTHRKAVLPFSVSWIVWKTGQRGT